MNWSQEYAAEQTTLARTIAHVAHKGQTRAGKPPEPYFRHVKRVASRFPPGPRRCVAYLHDVVEDTPVGFGDLDELGVDLEVVRAVDLLTHAHDVDHEAYVASIRRIAAWSGLTDAGRWARDVKLADLDDNLEAMYRLIVAGEHRLAARLEARYRAALNVLQGEAPDGR